MTYKDLQKKGKLLRSFDRYGQGPYDVYAGTDEYWAVGNDIYVRITNRNNLSYTGRPTNTSFFVTVDDIDFVEKAITSEYAEFIEGIPERITANNVCDIILSRRAPVPRDYLY